MQNRRKSLLEWGTRGLYAVNAPDTDRHGDTRSMESEKSISIHVHNNVNQEELNYRS